MHKEYLDKMSSYVKIEKTFSSPFIHSPNRKITKTNTRNIRPLSPSSS